MVDPAGRGRREGFPTLIVNTSLQVFAFRNDKEGVNGHTNSPAQSQNRERHVWLPPSAARRRMLSLFCYSGVESTDNLQRRKC